jgi:hypothetical protein
MTNVKKVNIEDTTENPENGIKNIVKQKRGRKSKKELQSILEQKESQLLKDNIVCSIEEKIVSSCGNDIDIVHDIENMNDINDIDNMNDNDNDNDNNEKLLINSEITENSPKVGAKKRGRKPKGGKIIQQITPSNVNKEAKPNIILHLKCSLKELQTNTINTGVESFNFLSSKNELNYEVIESQKAGSISQQNYNNETNTTNINNFFDDDCDNNDYDDNYSNKDHDIKGVWKKLKMLEHNLHVNNISDKKSACFWCTYEFDNPPVYIPKYFIKESYHVYGCFCSPECATAYLMEENIDSSAKFERYHLINNIYSKIYNYDKNIKPAPNPYYMLDKYYGNLSIQEYRALLRNERLFLIVDKPLTRILPELHEDNDDFIINHKIIPSNTYQVKKKIQRKSQSKNNILNEKFGLAQ